jgi:hypothetical protein
MKFLSAISILLLILVSCDSGHKTTGVTEGGNTGAIAGLIVDSKGAPVAGALVRLRPNGYVTSVPTGSAVALMKKGLALATSPTSLPLIDTRTNANGIYHIDSLPAGKYVVEGSFYDSLLQSKTALIRAADLTTQADSLFSADTLRLTAIVRGKLPDSMLTQGYRYAQVLGLDRLIEIDTADGTFEFDDLPPGNLILRFADGTVGTVAGRLIALELLEDDEQELGEIQETDDDSDQVVETDLDVEIEEPDSNEDLATE